MCNKGPAVGQSDHTGVWTQGLTSSTKRDYTDIICRIQFIFLLQLPYQWDITMPCHGALQQWSLTHSVCLQGVCHSRFACIYTTWVYFETIYKQWKSSSCPLMHIHTQTHTHARTHTHTHPHTHTRMHAHTQTVAYTHTLENILIPTHSETERPRVPVQNQWTKEWIGAWKMLHTRQQRPELCMVIFTWHASNYKVHKLRQRYIWWNILKDVPLVEFMYLVFTHMLGESYHRCLGSLLLCLCDVFRALINPLVCWFIITTDIHY